MQVPRRTDNNRICAFVPVILVVFAVFALVSLTPIKASAQSVPSTVNFQGRLLTAAGAVVADGTYNMEFRIYQDGTGTAAFNGGSYATPTGLDWTEDWLVQNGQGVVVKNGYFSVDLGSICSLTSTGTCLGNANSGFDFSDDTLWLSMNVAAGANVTASCGTTGPTFWSGCTPDGEMLPMRGLAAAPFSLNSQALDGLNASAFVQLSPSTAQSGSVEVTGGLQGSTASLTGTNSLTLGTSSALGQITFGDGTNSNTVVLQSGSTGSSLVTFTLPGSTGSSGDCLKDTNGAGLLGFSSCGSGVTLQSAYNNSTSPQITTTSAAPSLTIQSGTGDDSTSAFAVTPSGTATPTLDVDTTDNWVGINTATPASTLDVELPATSGVSINSITSPTVDQVSIDNTASSGVITANANGLHINYKGGSAAVEAAGMRIDYAPGTTSGSTWSGVRIVAGASGAQSGVASYGIKLEGPTTYNGGTDTAVKVATGWDIGVDIQSGGLQLAAQSDPASPAAGNLKIYAKSIAGLVVPEWISATDQNTPFQPGLGFNRIAYSVPNGTANCSTGATGFGSTSTGAGTCTSPAPASTRLMTSVRMEDYSTGTTAGTVSYQRQNVLQVWRGNAADLGGFFYTIRFGMGTLQSGNRAFVGLADSIANPTNVDPTTNTTPGKIGLAINANTGDWNFVNNITGTAPTVSNLGSSFPVNTTDLYELIMYSAEDGSTITYRVTDESTGAQVTNSISANLPNNATFLAPQFWITNNATAAAAILDFNGWYLQSDN